MGIAMPCNQLDSSESTFITESTYKNHGGGGGGGGGGGVQCMGDFLQQHAKFKISCRKNIFGIAFIENKEFVPTPLSRSSAKSIFFGEINLS